MKKNYKKISTFSFGITGNFKNLKFPDFFQIYLHKIDVADFYSFLRTVGQIFMFWHDYLTVNKNVKKSKLFILFYNNLDFYLYILFLYIFYPYIIFYKNIRKYICQNVKIIFNFCNYSNRNLI